MPAASIPYAVIVGAILAISIHAYGENLSRSRRDVLGLLLIIGVPVLLLQIPAGLLLAKAVVVSFIVYIICIACGYDPLKRWTHG